MWATGRMWQSSPGSILQPCITFRWPQQAVQEHQLCNWPVHLAPCGIAHCTTAAWHSGIALQPASLCLQLTCATLFSILVITSVWPFAKKVPVLVRTSLSLLSPVELSTTEDFIMLGLACKQQWVGGGGGGEDRVVRLSQRLLISSC